MRRFGERTRVSTQVTSWVPQSPFSPLMFSPALWLDAADAVTIVQTSNSVSQWSDKSGNGRNATQATQASQPITNTSTIGGLNALSFTGTGHLTVAAYTIPASGFTTFAVANQVTAGTGFIWEQSVDNTARRFFWRNGGTSQLFFGYHDGTAFRDYVTPWAAGAGARVVMGGTTGSNVALRFSPDAETTTARTGFPTTGSRAITVGRAANGASVFNGTIGELLIYDSELTAAQRDAVFTYLRAKWSV